MIARRVLKLAGGPNIELFQYAGVVHYPAARTFDYGYQHLAVRVGDLQKAAQKFLAAGGQLLQTADYRMQVKQETSPHQGWLYGRTPWESIIEMVTFKEA